MAISYLSYKISKVRSLFIFVSVTRGEETSKYRCICRKSAEKFNIARNDRGRTHKCNFSVFNRKFLFRANLVKKKSKLSVSAEI